MGRKLEQEKIQEILALRKKGMEASEIAKALNICYNSVYKYLNENGCYSINKFYINDEEIEEMTLLYKKGLTINEIATIINRKNETISKYLKKNGIEMNNHFRHISKETIDQIVDLYIQGKSMFYIEDILGIERHIVSDILKQNNIAIRDNTQYRTYELNEEYFDKIDMPNKAYILGFLYADGNVSKEKYRIQLSLQKGDREILEKISNEIGSTKPLYFRGLRKYNAKYKTKTQDQWAIDIHCKHMHESLERWGVIPCKTHDIVYPNLLDESLHSHFLRGVMDGDGCIHPPYGKNEKSKLVDICGTKMFCEGAKDIIEKNLGIHCSVINANNCIDRTTYKVTVSGGIQVPKFLDWIYQDADLKLERKYKLYEKYYKKDKEKEVA